MWSMIGKELFHVIVPAMRFSAVTVVKNNRVMVVVIDSRIMHVCIIVDDRRLTLFSTSV